MDVDQAGDDMAAGSVDGAIGAAEIVTDLGDLAVANEQAPLALDVL